MAAGAVSGNFRIPTDYLIENIRTAQNI